MDNLTERRYLFKNDDNLKRKLIPVDLPMTTPLGEYLRTSLRQAETATSSARWPLRKKTTTDAGVYLFPPASFHTGLLKARGAQAKSRTASPYRWRRCTSTSVEMQWTTGGAERCCGKERDDGENLVITVLPCQPSAVASDQIPLLAASGDRTGRDGNGELGDGGAPHQGATEQGEDYVRQQGTQGWGVCRQGGQGEGRRGPTAAPTAAANIGGTTATRRKGGRGKKRG